ncbi:MAG TPA: prepilin-type N-terminal cleavage/methylation domain-containing protein, partial [Pyrinomonadaceae bacterium]|nr:prepilin-type N-terminal cleavage/methylation domain-containing protein [Pyrinomonadaceae bacterium]
MNNNLKTSNSNKNGSNDKGFTMLEVIVAMTIFLIISGAIWGVLKAAMISRSTVNQQVQLAKNVRLALNIIGKDTYNAGFGYPVFSTTNPGSVVVLPDNRISTLLGIPVDFDTTRDQVTPIMAGNNITVDTYNTIAN